MNCNCTNLNKIILKTSKILNSVDKHRILGNFRIIAYFNIETFALQKKIQRLSIYETANLALTSVKQIIFKH